MLVGRNSVPVFSGIRTPDGNRQGSGQLVAGKPQFGEAFDEPFSYMSFSRLTDLLDLAETDEEALAVTQAFTEKMDDIKADNGGANLEGSDFTREIEAFLETFQNPEFKYLFPQANLYLGEYAVRNFPDPHTRQRW